MSLSEASRQTQRRARLISANEWWLLPLDAYVLVTVPF
jgi:hypothetical protein